MTESDENNTEHADPKVVDCADVAADAETIDALVTRLECERDEAMALRQRALADYANFQRRSVENEARARLWGITSFARGLMPVLDHFDLTLSQDLSKLSVEQIAKSVEMTRAELQRALEQQGLVKIDPAVGSEFNPMHHEAVTQMPLEGAAGGSIAMLFQCGWRLGDAVLRPAKVAVTPTE